jgi:hypothetical protein
MSIIDNHRKPRQLSNPVSIARNIVEFGEGLLGAPDESGVRFTTLRTLSAEASGPGTRKKAGKFRTNNTRAITDYLSDRNEAAYFPKAQAALQSEVEAKRLKVPINRNEDVMALLPGDQVVVVVSRSTEIGLDLLEGRLHPVYDHDSAPRTGLKERVQRANALGVIAVAAMLNPLWGK